MTDPVKSGDRLALQVAVATLAKLTINIGHRMVYPFLPAMAALGITCLAMVANELLFLIFGTWMESSYGLSVSRLGLAAAVIGMAELLGEIGVGGLVDRLGKRRSVAIGLGFTAAGYVALALNSVDLWAALIWLFALFICFEFMIVATIPLVTELVPAARGTMLALNLASSSLGRATGALIALPSGWWVGCSGPDWRPERSHSARQACCYDTSTIPSAAGRMTVP